jgi:ribosomal protein S18 acetylase RimI-like enzyme
MTLNDTLSIEKVTPNEAAELLELAVQTFIETYHAVNTELDMRLYLAENFTNEQIVKEINTEGSEFYSVKIEQRWVGYLKVNVGSAQTENPVGNSLEIERIYVLAEFYGKGVAQQIYNKALFLARAHKSDFLWLGVWEENPRAIRFYQKCGFAVFDHHKFKLGSCIQTDLMMRLELNDVHPKLLNQLIDSFSEQRAHKI